MTRTAAAVPTTMPPTSSYSYLLGGWLSASGQVREWLLRAPANRKWVGFSPATVAIVVVLVGDPCRHRYSCVHAADISTPTARQKRGRLQHICQGCAAGAPRTLWRLVHQEGCSGSISNGAVPHLDDPCERGPNQAGEVACVNQNQKVDERQRL